MRSPLLHYATVRLGVNSGLGSLTRSTGGIRPAERHRGAPRQRSCHPSFGLWAVDPGPGRFRGTLDSGLWTLDWAVFACPLIAASFQACDLNRLQATEPAFKPIRPKCFTINYPCRVEGLRSCQVESALCCLQTAWQFQQSFHLASNRMACMGVIPPGSFDLR